MREPQFERAAGWVYRGIWKLLSGWFCVPEDSPTLPAVAGKPPKSFHPSRRYLSYLKLYFWLFFVPLDLVLAVAWSVLHFFLPLLGAILALPVALLATVPPLLIYIAIHLHFDTTWYVMTSRSLRCRRGIWVIVEHTITFENVQNVYVTRGPVETLFGIAEIVVETAGASAGEGHSKFSAGNKAVFEGIANPEEIRALILDRVRASKTAGLGDEHEHPGWSREHVAVLREIRALLRPQSPKSTET